jgi:hypothetical protein
LVTPRVCRNTASTPQKQPPANTAVSLVIAFDAVMSFSGFGSTVAFLRRAGHRQQRRGHQPDREPRPARHRCNVHRTS